MSVSFEYRNMNLGRNFTTSNLLIVINELLSDAKSTKNTLKINVNVDCSLIDVLSCDNKFIIKSETSKKKYVLNDNNSILELICDYSHLEEPSYNVLLKQSIKNKLQESEYVNDDLSSTSSTSSTKSSASAWSVNSNLLSKLESCINNSKPEHVVEQSQPLQKPTFVLTKIPEQSDKIEIQKSDKTETNQLETNISDMPKEDYVVDVELTQDEKNMLANMSNDEIEKAMSKLANIKSDIDKELLYDEEVAESRRIRKEKENKRKCEEKLSVFESDKSYTYKKIYADMFINTNKNGDHYIQSFEQIPELFIVKYVIFLYMDGRNTDGELVRDRLLDTPNEYELYEMLYNVLTNENYVVPDDDKLQSIAENFINTLPPIQIVTEEQIMKALNDPNDPIFNEDETSQCSVDDEYGDTKISAYQM